MVPLLAMAASLALALAAGGRGGDVVHTGHGDLRCEHVGENSGVRQCVGIPFAAPPVGDLRWRPPQQPAHWAGVRDARAPTRPICIQVRCSATIVTLVPALSGRHLRHATPRPRANRGV